MPGTFGFIAYSDRTVKNLFFHVSEGQCKVLECVEVLPPAPQTPYYSARNSGRSSVGRSEESNRDTKRKGKHDLSWRWSAEFGNEYTFHRS